MAKLTSIDNLPGELHNRVLSHLNVIDRIALKLTSAHFNSLIPKLSAEELLEAEESRFAQDHELYGCYDCLRLRSSDKFADQQLKRKRRKFGADASKRFCVDCGFEVREGRVPPVRYVRGNHVTIRGKVHIVCTRCNKFGLMAKGEGQREYGDLCTKCWQTLREALQRQERERLRTEQAERRDRRRRVYGSEYEDSDDDDAASLTWSEEAMAIADAEASMYMNSPKWGSD